MIAVEIIVIVVVAAIVGGIIALYNMADKGENPFQ